MGILGGSGEDGVRLTMSQSDKISHKWHRNSSIGLCTHFRVDPRASRRVINFTGLMNWVLFRRMAEQRLPGSSRTIVRVAIGMTPASAYIGTLFIHFGRTSDVCNYYHPFLGRSDDA